MIRLIRNEIYKLHRRHFFILSFLIIVLALGVYTTIFYMQTDNRTDMDIVSEQLNREKEYLSQIESVNWETDLEMQSAILTSQAKIDRLQYMLDHQIADWDWRSDVLAKYYTNQTILSLLNNGQNPEDYGFTDLGNYTKTTLVQKLTNQCDVQINMVENNDYMSYSQEQLAALQQQYSQNYTSMSTLEAALADIEIESWKQYIQYQTPPGAIDQWKSVAIEELAEEKETLARYQYDPTAFEDMTEEERDRQYTWTKRRLQINQYALKTDTIPLSIYEKMAEHANTVTYSSYLISLKQMMMVVLAICVSLAAFIMSGEFKRGTISQLVLAPYSRSAIAGAKMVSLILISLIYSCIVPIFGMIAGRLLFSNQMIGQTMSSGAVPAFISNLRGNIVEFPFRTYILMQYAAEFMKIMILSLITLAFTTVTESVAAPLLIMLILSLTGAQIYSTIYNFVYPAKILRYLLFGNLNFVQYLEGSWVAPYPTALTSIVVVSVWTIVSIVVYFFDFKYKEIAF